MSERALEAEFAQGICRIRLARPASGNAIDARLLAELDEVLRRCEADAEGAPSVVVLQGAPEVFCTGGDLGAAAGTEHGSGAASEAADPDALYGLWLRLARGPFVSVALVEGRANAGGLGFVAACDLAFAGPAASFGLSELLFGLFPACVLPFLVRRVGLQKAHVLTLTTRPMNAEEALACGLVDALGEPPEALLRRELTRLRRLSRPAIARYKRYLAELPAGLEAARPAAVAANRALFEDPQILRDIRRYLTEQKFPWEN